MSESSSLSPRKSQRNSFLLSLLAVVSLSLFRLWSDSAARPFDTIAEQSPSYHVWSDVAHEDEAPSPFDIIIESTHEHKDSPFEGAFPDVNTTDRMETFSNLTDLVELQNLPVPHNLNILFMGDSLSRFQYVDLVYFLSHNGTFPSPDDVPNMVVEKTHKHGWVQYFNFSNSALQPYEQCDCFRTNTNLSNIIENRYYHDPERNNTVTYLQKFGSHPFKSSWNVSDVHNAHSLVQSESELNFIYNGADWVDAIRDFVCQISPKPSLFIFNSGLWPNNDLKNVELQHKIIKALQACEIRSMFKTTTKAKQQSDSSWAEYERQLCRLTDSCMDVRWTALVPGEYYCDNLHFREPVYSLLNVQLLSLITSHHNFPEFSR